MGYLEIFEMNELGAGFADISKITFADSVELDLALVTPNSASLLCVVCLIPIPSGMGHSFCNSHNR